MSQVTDLSSLLRALPNGRMTENEVKSILRQMLELLEPMHAQHPAQLNLHIHPDNITIDAQGCVTLKYTQSGTDGFVPGYAPEEQTTAEMDSIGPWTDLFGLGATLFKLVTGQNPPALMALTERGGLDLNAFPADVSLPFRQLIQYLMRPVRYHRPRSVADIRMFMDNKGVSLPNGTFPVPSLQQQVVQPPVTVSPQTTPSDIPQAVIADTTTTDTPPVRVSSPKEQETPVQKPASISQPKPPTSGSSALLWVCIILIVLIGAGVGLFFAQPKFLTNLLDGAKHKTSLLDKDRRSNDDDDTDDSDDTGSDEETDSEDGVKVVRSSAGTEFTIEGQRFVMVPIRGGQFTMGRGDYSDETPHDVRLSDYYIGQTEVTKGLWEAVTGEIPDENSGEDSMPVVNVSYADCIDFIEQLNWLLPESCSFKFRLPTEAEWEYAARGGQNNATIYSGTNEELSLDDYAWYSNNSDDKIHPVALRQANRFGLYDMSGNVWEWCHDWYSNAYYEESPTSDPQGPEDGEKRVTRGGSCSSSSGSCRSTYRLYFDPSAPDSKIGLRLAADKL